MDKTSAATTPASNDSLARSFAPIANPDAEALILGSMPGVASLTAGEYYAHPRNAFWPIMERLFGTPRALPYMERVRRLADAKIAVWDVLRSCYREGSLDSSIQRDSEVANDFAEFFARHPKLRLVVFNGQKAETAFKRHALPSLTPLPPALHFARVPSTSPAHAARTFEEKLAAWRKVFSQSGFDVDT